MLSRPTARTLFAGLIVALLTVAVACSSDTDDGATGEPTSSASPNPTSAPSGDVLTPADILTKDPSVTKHEEIEWGAMFELTGPLAGFGEPSADGLKMAVQEINDAGGFQVGDTIYTIKLIEHDTRSDIAQSLAVASELLLDDGVDVLWGPAAIGDPEITALTQEREVLHLCPCPERELTSLTSVEQAQDESRWAFQTLPAASRFLPVGAETTRRDYPQFDTFATICVNSATGQAFCDFFKDAYEDAGFDHVAQQLFPAGTTDFSPFITSLKRDDPDLVLNFTDAGVAQFSLLRQSWELDVGRFHISVELPYELWESLVGGAGIRDTYVAAGAAPRGHAQYTSEKARAFFEDKYEPFKGALPPAAFAALLTYDPAYMLMAAMQRAGTVDDTTAFE
jgi:branched-chain amino acid transport system substrate-binding protein